MPGAKFKDFITCKDKYSSAFQITKQEDADEYFSSCVEHTMRLNTELTEKEAIELEKDNIAYFACYTNNIDIRKRIEKLFNCEHPLFGSVDNPLSADEIFLIGKAIGEASGEKEEISIKEMKNISKKIRESFKEKRENDPKPIRTHSEKKKLINNNPKIYDIGKYPDDLQITYIKGACDMYNIAYDNKYNNNTYNNPYKKDKDFKDKDFKDIIDELFEDEK